MLVQQHHYYLHTRIQLLDRVRHMPTFHKTDDNKKQQIFNTLALLRLSMDDLADKMYCDMVLQRIRQGHKIDQGMLKSADLLIAKWSK